LVKRFEENKCFYPKTSVFPTKVAEFKATICIRGNIADVRVVSKNFDLMCQEPKAEITLKTECGKNGPIIFKD